MKLYRMEDNRWKLEVPTTEGRTQTVLFLTDEEVMEIKNMFVVEPSNVQKHLIVNSLHLRKGDYAYLYHIACKDGILQLGDESIFVDKLPTKLMVDISYLRNANMENLPTSLRDCIDYAKSEGCSYIDFNENKGDNHDNIIEGLTVYKGARLCEINLASLISI